MNIKWTEEQKKIIESRNKNLIVSAAAGSGKTAVLVERIVSIVTDKNNPVDIDRLLIVTYTKAAAGEMKERLRERFEKLSAADKGSGHLRKQTVLIHNAHISTIHGFCSYVIKNYFYNAGIDPLFRIMEDAEAVLMKKECAKEVIARAMLTSENDNEHLNRERVSDFSAACLGGKKTKRLEELLISIYEKLIADPWPYEWLENIQEKCLSAEKDRINEPDIIRELEEECETELKSIRRKAEINLKTVLLPAGPSAYIKTAEAEYHIIKAASESASKQERTELLKKLNMQRLSTARPKAGEDPSIRESCKKTRDEIRETAKNIIKTYKMTDADELLKETMLTAGHINTLCELLREFMDCFALSKRNRNLMDFADLEHFALKILVQKNSEPTAAARELAAGFVQVMTDEYQDSNDIQELILESVSGKCNRFMVGDIKQSIYGFRHAKPEIFAGKYTEYNNSGESESIDLHNNYRSRKQVIDTVNHVFGKLMSKELGGVDYSDGQELYAKADYPDSENPYDDDPYKTEIMLADIEEDQTDKRAAIEAEALMTAKKILAMKESLRIYDKKTRQTRAFRFGDCAVLLRSVKEWSEIFYRVFQAKGIPARTDSKTGYFKTVEVMTVINYLKIIDNPLQEIPLTSVLFSDMVGCSAKELAEIRAFSDHNQFYNAVREYAVSGRDNQLKEKISGFLNSYDMLRVQSDYSSVQNLIRNIYKETGIRSCSAAMPAGEQRAANLDMLILKAAEYEKTSYHGLYNFIRYIEDMEKHQQDYGAAALDADEADVVKIMTIHKSKGLEYPVVIISGCSHEFNLTDTTKSVLFHREMGIGLDAVDLITRKKKTSFLKRMIINRIKKESLSEELRILYVALTRAKEKIIITGSRKKLASSILKWNEKAALYKNTVSADAAAVKCYLDWLVPSFADQSAFSAVMNYAGDYSANAGKNNGEDIVRFEISSAGDLLVSETEELLKTDNSLERLHPRDDIMDHVAEELLIKIEDFEYRYKLLSEIPQKISVSDLKARLCESVHDGEAADFERHNKTVFLKKIPGFISEQEPNLPGAARGTAYHKCWKNIDYQVLGDPEFTDGKLLKENIEDQISVMLKKGLLRKEEAAVIDPADIASFFMSDIGGRMILAEINGSLMREQPFTLGAKACEINPDWHFDDTVIIQGIIDACFYEDDAWVIVDYKTDKVKTLDELAHKYKSQLNIYAAAVEKSTGKTVKEKIIYSSELKDMINI